MYSVWVKNSIFSNDWIFINDYNDFNIMLSDIKELKKMWKIVKYF